MRGLLAEAIPYTLQLTALALLFDALLGIALAIVAAVKQYSALDKTVTIGILQTPASCGAESEHLQQPLSPRDRGENRLLIVFRDERECRSSGAHVHLMR